MNWNLDPSALTFIPLGGTGEIGMNLNLYGHKGQWLMVDCGMLIDNDAEDEASRILVPDISFIASQRENLVGLLITHAHEDHIGAVAALWPQLKCPIYATPFAAAVIRSKLGEYGLAGQVPIQEHEPRANFRIGHFKIETLPITHSVPENTSVVIRTGIGPILHTGDWKLDPEPLLGPATDPKPFKKLGKRGGVAAVIGDSTNATREGHSGSESAVRQTLIERIGQCEGRVVGVCFSSNVARIQTFVEAAIQNRRDLVITGRSMERMVSAAQATGILPRDLPRVPLELTGYIPPERVMVLCTGSQGEPAAALHRIARYKHPHVALEPGDTVFFSSRIIPGNELPIAALHSMLTRDGVHVVSEQDAMVHVSGHPCQEELAEMYDWVQPRSVIPVHGYPPHLEAHRTFASDHGVPDVLDIRNGDVVEIRAESVEVVGRVQVGRVARPQPPYERLGRGGRKPGGRGRRRMRSYA